MEYGLTIRLFGPFRVERDGQAIAPEVWRGRKPQDLLKILVLARGRYVAKDQLLEWLWPDSPPEAAESNLYAAVSRLRRALEPDLATGRASAYIVTRPEGYAFDPARAWVDLFEYEQLLEAVRPEDIDRILALRSEDLLEEDPYAPWAEVARASLRAARQRALRRLADACLQAGNPQEAARVCEAALQEEPAQETLWRTLMQAYWAAGDRAAALQAFERCRNALTRELGVDPLPETTELHERILREEPPVARPGSVRSAATPTPWLVRLGAAGIAVWVGATAANLALSLYGLRTAGVALTGDPAAEVLPRLAENPQIAAPVLRAWPLLVAASLALLPGYIAWFALARARPTGSTAVPALAWVGLGLGGLDVLGQMANRLLVFGRLAALGTAYPTARPETQLLFYLLWDLLRQFASIFGFLSVVAHPMAVTSLSLAAWGHPRLPTWLLGTGLLVACVQLAYSLVLPFTPFILWSFPLGLAVATLALGWLLALARSLWLSIG